MAFVPPGLQTFNGSNGLPLSLGTIGFYVPGTLTPKDTYSDSGLTALNTNPVLLDALGRAAIWGTGSYRQIAKDANGNTLWDRVVDTLDVGLSAALASTAAGEGASLVGFIQSGTGAVSRTAEDKLREVISAEDFGAVGDGTTDDTAAINAMLAVGGLMELPGPATYKISDRLLMTVSRSELWIGANVTITGNPWTYPGSQTPFGSLILVTGNNCSVVGAGMGSSLIQITGGSAANGVTFLHVDGGYAADFTVDGAMASGAGITDDTFQSGVAVFNDSASRPTAKASKVVIERIEARNWLQYGLQAWGNLAMVDFVDCWSHDNGKAGDANSVGAGIALTNGNTNVTVRGCTITGNKKEGIFQSSAGVAASDIKFLGNTITGNGSFGISCMEDTGFSSIAGVGTIGIVSSGNTISGNALGGIRFGTYSNVGIIKNASSVGDQITGNTGPGVIVQTNTGPTTTRIIIDSLIEGNTTGVTTGADIDDTVRWNATKIRGNTTDISNNGTSLLVSNARGLGTSIASAATIAIPADGDTFVLTGTTTITNITADPGRTVTFIFGGNITIAHTGNVVMGASDFVGTANVSTLQLACFGGSWFKVAGSVNV